MELIDIILHRGYISSAVATLWSWNSKKPNARAKEMSEQLEECLKGFDWLETQLLESRRRNKEWESVVREIQRKLDQKEKENQELEEKIKNIQEGL